MKLDLDLTTPTTSQVPEAAREVVRMKAHLGNGDGQIPMMLAAVIDKLGHALKEPE